jgi:DNA-binding CsgD family transcriptional regulator
MYKYLPITSNISEMLVAITSLPTCTLVFDSKADLVDMNLLAANFLKIKDKEAYLNKRLKIDVDYVHLQYMLSKLIKGKSVVNETICIRRTDGSNANVKFSGSMLYGVKKIFLFQFYEIMASIDARNHDSKHIISQLFAKYPSLTRNEVEICGLIANKTPAREVSDILHKSPNNVYVTLRRITHKLNLKSSKELYPYLKEINDPTFFL